MMGRRGVALIVVLGVLVLLAMLATTFATLTAVERAVSRNYLDEVRARLIAQSGVEHAFDRLSQTASLRGFVADDSWKTFSDSMDSGTYAMGGDAYEVRVTDTSAQINVNDGALQGPDHPVSRNLRRILNILGAHPKAAVPELGDRILKARSVAGYVHKLDLLRALGFDSAAYRRVKDFLTVASWSDPNVANPVPLSAETASLYPVEFPRPGGIYRVGHQRNYRGDVIRAPLLFFDPANPVPSHNAVWGRDSLFPQWIEIVSRSPVNVNTARREVLEALLTDLEGFFLVERRRETPRGGYAWTDVRYTYDATGDEGDECGFLYRTVPIVGPGGRSATGIPASAIADEILACRSRKTSEHIAGLDYGAAPFGGPFRSWAQFNRFVDNLAEGGVLGEGRSATADVLKANFNPNLHLNEANPNGALFTHVDKTDLLVNSTEFCFTPMGTFEIESVGRVGAAEKKLLVHARLFDAVRETSQRQFHAGSFSERKSGPETNNTWSLETGPEPDNGPAPLENGYEGYLQLPTLGSNLSKPGLHKPKGALWTTLSDPAFYPEAVPISPGGEQFGSVIHAHFQLDHAAHHHANRNLLTTPPNWDGFRLPQGARQTVFGNRCCINRNWEDRTESLMPPYSPVDDPRRFRLARSFSGDPPAGFEYAPSDLRLDGAYAERGSAFGYWIEENVSFNFNEGAAAFWLKPAFFPEMTGKTRTLLSMGRYHAHDPMRMNSSPFALFFVPGERSAGTIAPEYAQGITRFRPSSFAFGYGFSNETGYNWEMMGQGDPPQKHATSHAFAFSPTLNRGGEGPLRAHEWVHVGVTWDNPRGRLPTPDSVQIYINGRILPGTVGMPHLYPEGAREGQPFSKTPRWTLHSRQVSIPGLSGPAWCVNSIRLGGEPSMLFDPDLVGVKEFFPRNFSADATFDEFYVWLDRSRTFVGGLAGIETLWKRGRYYKPDDDNPADALFTSQSIAIPAGNERSPSRPRLLAVSWTELAGEDGRMFDRSTDPPRELRPAGSFVDLYAEAGGVGYGPFRDAAWSPVRASSGAPPELSGSLRYRAKLKMGGARRPGTILLSTPVLDDVTLFHDRGGPEILGWVFLGAGE